MAAKHWIIGIIVLSISFITFIVLFNLKLITKAVFFIFLFFFIMAILIGVILRFQDVERKGSIINSKAKQNSLRYIFDRINEELEEMPDSEVLLWEKGKDITTATRDFTDNNGKNNRFISIQAVTKFSRKTIVVYYNATEGVLWDWRGSPSPTILSDPFYNFQPYQKSYGMGTPGGIIRDKYRKSQRSKGLVIMPNEEEYSEPDDFVDRLNI